MLAILGYFILICHVLLQSKLQGLAGQHANMLETLSPPVRKRVEALREIQVLVFSLVGASTAC